VYLKPTECNCDHGTPTTLTTGSFDRNTTDSEETSVIGAIIETNSTKNDPWDDFSGLAFGEFDDWNSTLLTALINQTSSKKLASNDNVNIYDNIHDIKVAIGFEPLPGNTTRP